MAESANPAHYAAHEVAPIDLMAAYGIADQFCIGSAVKHLMRSPEKDGAVDFHKAIWYSAYVFAKSRGADHKKALEIAIATTFTANDLLGDKKL